MVTTDNAIVSLEWTRFLSKAEAEARTETGKALVLKLKHSSAWAKDLVAARKLQQETQEVTALLDRDALWGPLTGLIDPDKLFESLARGTVLELSELSTLRGWLYAMDSWTQTPRDTLKGEHFKKALNSLSEPFEAIRILDRVLTPDGQLSERASPKLAAINTEIRAIKKKIQTTMDHLMRTLSEKGVLQENFSDVRDGHYVLPVKTSSQSSVEGTIYESSASKQTVFLEPKEVAPLNSRLQKRQNDLIEEIFIILQATSKALRPFTSELLLSVAVISHWDAVQAKGRLALHYGGKSIHVSEEMTFVLQDTAHPLLWWSLTPDQIIRNEVEFGEPTRTLLLTGPNTGGKTVLLKTLGLAGICARTGFLFPAVDTPTVPFFDSFFVDVGDHQSIEHHLSSFSGHIMRFKEILENVTSRSLVLIDELNSATDPGEGGALGQAFLETVMSRGAVIVATTHDPQLKALAISDTRILNASMAFDETSRSPTYQMILGIPGRSRALETAERLGMPHEVLTLARKYLSTEHLVFEKMLAKLEADTAETGRARKEAIHLRDEAERLKNEWTEKTGKAVQEMLERTRQKLRRIVEIAQDEVRATVRKLDESKNRRDVDQTRSSVSKIFSNSADDIESALQEEAPEVAKTIQNLRVEKQSVQAPQITEGAQVRIPKWKTLGTVLSTSGNKVRVQMGTMQMSLALSDLELFDGPTAPKKKMSFHDQDRPSAPDPKIDLRGIRFEEAMSSLEHYLDQAFRSGAMSQVTVVHGLGTGAIREGARALFKSLPYIKEYKDGGAGHGGAGATIVEFER